MQPADFERLSRALSHALRHEPWLYELEPDEEGWTEASNLLSALRRESPAWSALSKADLRAMIARSSKARHEMQGGRIRALYGHSLPGRLKKTKAEPPALLFHGTSPAVVGQIRVSGLLPMNRQYVHLSIDRDMAIAVGLRKAPAPVVLVIKAAEAHAAGYSFYVGNEKVWLADEVTLAFINFEQA